MKPPMESPVDQLIDLLSLILPALPLILHATAFSVSSYSHLIFNSLLPFFTHCVQKGEIPCWLSEKDKLGS